MSVFNDAPRVLAEVLLIKGDNDFGHWRRDATCRHCAQRRLIVPPQALCEATRRVLMHHLIDEADTYYLIVTRQRRFQDGAPLRADVGIKVSETAMARNGWVVDRVQLYLYYRSTAPHGSWEADSL